MGTPLVILPNDHVSYMRFALERARLSPPAPPKFCVGAILVDADVNQVISTGYSLEFPGNMLGDGGDTHAEQCCFMKLAEECGLPTVHPEDHIHQVLPRNTVLYTTLEPCNERQSGNTTCLERILKLKGFITAVYIGMRKPGSYLETNTSVDRLEREGIEVKVMEQIHDEVYAVSTAGYDY